MHVLSGTLADLLYIFCMFVMIFITQEVRPVWVALLGIVHVVLLWDPV